MGRPGCQNPRVAYLARHALHRATYPPLRGHPAQHRRPAAPRRPRLGRAGALGAGEVAERRQQMSAERDTAEPDTHTSAAMAAGSDVHASVFIASTANVRGRITAEESASVWYSNTL